MFSVAASVDVEQLFCRGKTYYDYDGAVVRDTENLQPAGPISSLVMARIDWDGPIPNGPR